MGPDTLGKFLKGDIGSPRADNLAKVLQALSISNEPDFEALDDLTHTPTNNAHGVRFGGVVEAGAWRINEDADQDAGFRTIPIPPDSRYPREAQFAFEVVGDSMTEVGLFEGMFALAVNLYAWQRLHGEPGDGKLVVVARTRNGDPERELTVKQLRLFRDRMELQPRSQNPRWHPLVFPLPPREDQEREAQIIAVVLHATRLY